MLSLRPWGTSAASVLPSFFSKTSPWERDHVSMMLRDISAQRLSRVCSCQNTVNCHASKPAWRQKNRAQLTSNIARARLVRSIKHLKNTDSCMMWSCLYVIYPLEIVSALYISPFRISFSAMCKVSAHLVHTRRSLEAKPSTWRNQGRMWKVGSGYLWFKKNASAFLHCWKPDIVYRSPRTSSLTKNRSRKTLRLMEAWHILGEIQHFLSSTLQSVVLEMVAWSYSRKALQRINFRT